MSEPKAFASLSSSLLARKGQAKPAMRPQGFAGFGMASPPVHDDLGWNDMGHDVQTHSAEIVPIVPELASAPVSDPVAAPEPVLQREEIAREFMPAPVVVPLPEAKKPRAAAGSKGKSAFTLRLDPERHLRLRLACAVHHRSAQQVVVHALDMFLATQTDVSELAAKAASSAKTKR